MSPPHPNPNRHFHLPLENPDQPNPPLSLLLCSCRLLVVALAEEGQGCLIPGPYFPGFDKVLNVARVRAWLVHRDPTIRGGAAGGGVEGEVDQGISPRALQSAMR